MEKNCLNTRTLNNYVLNSIMSNFAYTNSIDKDKAFFDGDEFRHQIKVLRRRTGDCIDFLDGHGRSFKGRVLTVDNLKKRFQVEITACDIYQQPLPLLLMVALPKSSKIDTIIQKSVELGVSRITPLLTSRTIVRIDSKGKIATRRQHWHRVAVASLKQSGNPFIPIIDEPIALDDLKKSKDSTFPVDEIVFHPQADELFSETVRTLNKEAATRLILGPEGGLDEDEIVFLRSQGCKVSSLGKRVMRLETAVVSALTLVQFVKS